MERKQPDILSDAIRLGLSELLATHGGKRLGDLLGGAHKSQVTRYMHAGRMPSDRFERLAHLSPQVARAVWRLAVDASQPALPFGGGEAA